MSLPRLSLKPRTGVSSLEFGPLIDAMIIEYQLVRDDELSVNSWEGDTYVAKEFGLRVDCINRQIENINCSKSLFFENCDLIGEKFDDLTHGVLENFEALRDKDFLWVGDSQQSIFHIDELGINLWIDKFGHVDSIDCFRPD